MRGAAVVFFAYIWLRCGFDCGAGGCQSATRHADRHSRLAGHLHGALRGGRSGATGIVPYNQLDVPDPIPVGINAIGVKLLAPIMNLGIIIGLTSVILVLLLGQPRIFYSIARDGLLPPVAAMVHPRSRTPMFRRSSLGVVNATLKLAENQRFEIVGFLALLGRILWFDPRREHSSIPTANLRSRRAQGLSRLAASSRPPAGPGLDWPEHGGILDRIGAGGAHYK
jgi:basic amino acid/polyamine antiporter, APA family